MTRRSFSALAGGVAAVPGISLLADESKTVFPFGTHVYREPSLPLEQLRADFPILKKLGFTMIKIQESWSTDEKREGEIDLSRVARVVSDARQNGLVVYFGVTMEQAPAWLWKKYPEASMVYETGQPQNDPTQYLLPTDGKPGPCWHHPEARAAATRFMEEVGRQIGQYDNIRVWNVWQEIGFWTMRPGHLGLCYCQNSLREFRTWRRGKYGALDKLNSTWRTGFGEWEEVEPPRAFAQVPSWIDWRFFMDDVYITGVLRFKAEAFRRNDPGHRPVLAHTASPTYGGTAEWRYAGVLDVIGSSAYPAWGELGDPDITSAQRVRQPYAVYQQLWENIMMKFDYVRSASETGEIWCAELQGGRAGGGPDPGRVPDAGDIRRWVLGPLAAGARGICFWNHRSEPFWSEGYGFGLLELKGDTTERAAEAGRLGKAINSHADLFVSGVHPRSKVAIVLDEDLWHFVEGTGGAFKEQFTHSLSGIYRALFDEGIQVDFLDSARIAQEGADYRVLLLPCPSALGPEVIEALRAYVRAGGTLVSEATAGRYDRYGFGMAGEMAPELAELFGARHLQLYTLKPETTRSLTGAGAFERQRVSGSLYLQILESTSGSAVLKYRDEVAACTNQYGKGQAYLVGTLLGPAILPEKSAPENRQFLAALLERAGVKADRVGNLQRRRRNLGSKSAWFFLNCTHETVQESVPLEDFRSAAPLLGGDLEIREGKVLISAEPMDICCLILEKT